MLESDRSDTNESITSLRYIIRRSSYYDFSNFTNICEDNINYFSLFSFNIEFINAKFNELTIFIEELESINFKFSIICLQECWIADNCDLSQVKHFATKAV